MKIKKAAEICHMSPRNIRFYEEIGLIKPTRVENGYRDYDTEDIERLQQIRVLRNLGIGVESIKAYFKKEKTFEQIIKERKKELDLQRKDMDALYRLCEQLEHQDLPLSSSVTHIIENTLQEKKNKQTPPVYGKLLSSNVKNRLSRRALLLNLLASFVLFMILGYIFFGSLLNTLLSYRDTLHQSIINLLIFIIVIAISYINCVYSCKSTYFELREDGIYYMDKQSPCSYWNVFKHILKNDYLSCMEFVSFDDLAAVKVDAQTKGMITGGSHLISFFIILFTKDERAIRLDSNLFFGEDHFMLVFRVLHDKAPKWIDSKHLDRILELPHEKAYKILDDFYWEQRPWHKTPMYQKWKTKQSKGREK